MNLEKKIKKKTFFSLYKLILSLVILTQLKALLLFGQQQQQPAKTITNSIDNNFNRIGLAPHNRPSCQFIDYNNNNKNQRKFSNQQELTDEIKIPILNEFNNNGKNNNNNNNNTSQTPPQILISTTTIPNNDSNEIDKILLHHHQQQQQQQQSAPTTSTANNQKIKLDTSERLRQLRQLLINNNYDAYLVTPNDEHGSEYVTDYDRRLKFISGFTGSNGYALILLDKAVLFTDGRYTLQADQDLDCNWWLVSSEEPEMDIHLWLAKNSIKNLKIATDARLMPLKTFDYLDEQLKKLDCEFALISQDLIDVVWNNNNDPIRLPPQDSLFVHKLQFTGNISWQEKVIKLAESMEKLHAQHYIISHLDDIAWLLNLRGNDIPMSPLFKSYLFISLSQIKQQQQQQAQSQSQSQAQLTNLEQLLLFNHQQQVPILQSPQVLHVQPNQFIRITMYVDLKKITKQVREHLHLDNGTTIMHSDSNNNKQTRIQVDLKDYEIFIMDLRDKLTFVSASAAASAVTNSNILINAASQLASTSQSINGNNQANNNNNLSTRQQLEGKLLLDANANVAIHILAKTYENRLILIESLINKLKSIKTDSEVNGMRLAHYRDSLAISMLLAKLEFDIEKSKIFNKWTEIGAANELEFYRSLMDFNKGQSFPSISAYGSQAAIVHYQPKLEDKIIIGNLSTYLIDSGGQYLDGTTDITRTVHFGEPTNFHCETYTRVLMGAIDMMSLIFEQSKRSSFKLNDLLARRYLFELGLNYQHGTGHGIGLYSLVHENPYLIEHFTTTKQHQQQKANQQTNQFIPPILSEPTILQPNMFTSIEPGYYKANDFGIRLENIVVTQKFNFFSNNSTTRQNDRQQQQQTNQIEHMNESMKQFLRLEPISLVPFEPKLIKFELLSNKQKAWLNSYNLMVRLRLTQQINYYLAKIKNSQSIQALNITTGQKQQQNGYYNFLNLPGDQFKEKLELTHKWIMSKTELIPLDVPQSLVMPQQQQQQQQQQQNENNSGLNILFSKLNKNEGNKKRDFNDQPLRSSSAIDGKRLMLTYMSSLPFNDLDASEAIATIQQQQQQQQNDLIGRAEFENNINNNKTVQHSNKCAGLECDLWLLQSINSMTSSPSSYYQKQLANKQELNSKMAINSNQMPTTWTETLIEPDERLINNEKTTTNSLMDLFTLNGINSNSSIFSSINFLWSALFVCLFVILQLTIMTYICRSRGSRGFCLSSTGNSTESVRSRSRQSSMRNNNNSCNNNNNHHLQSVRSLSSSINRSTNSNGSCRRPQQQQNNNQQQIQIEDQNENQNNSNIAQVSV